MDATQHTPELFQRWPRLHSALPFVRLADTPTPVERVRLAPSAGVSEPRGGLWIKRDDLSGARYGGNKVRKLEFILGAALAAEAHGVWTIGAIGSHHALATAIYGAQCGLEVEVVHFPQPVTPHVLHNLRAIGATSARLELLRNRELLPVAMLRKRARDAGTPRRWYGVSGGGSSPLGTLGYVNAALELAAQVRAGVLPEPAQIYVATGSCGTFAGLWLGAKLAGLKTEVIGVRVVDMLVTNEVVAAALIYRTLNLLRSMDPSIPRLRVTPRVITLRHGYLGEGYGVGTPAGARAMATFASADHTLDPTYTGKAASALLDALASPKHRPDGPVVFWNTLSSADLTPYLDACAGPGDLPAEYRSFWRDAAS